MDDSFTLAAKRQQISSTYDNFFTTSEAVSRSVIEKTRTAMLGSEEICR